MKCNYFFISLQRELRRLRQRPRYFVLLTLGIVFSYVFFFSLMIEGQPQDLPIAVVDHDGSYLSRRVCHELNATQGVKVVAVYASHAEARKAMQRQEIYAFMEIPENAYSDLLDFKRPHLAIYSNNAYLLAGSLSYKQLATMGKMASAAVHREILKKKGMDEEASMRIIQPVEFDAHLISNPTANYQPYVLTSILPGIVAYIALLFSVFKMTSEQKEKTAHEWVGSAGGNLTVAVLAKLLPYTLWFTLLGVVGNLLFFGPCHYPLVGSFGWIVLDMFLLVVAAQGMGVLIASLIPEMHLAVSVSAIYGALSFSMSGFSYPVDSMVPALQAFSNLFPLRHYYLVYAKVAHFGCGLGQCWPHFCMLLACVAAGFLGIWLLHKQMVSSQSLPANE